MSAEAVLIILGIALVVAAILGVIGSIFYPQTVPVVKVWQRLSLGVLGLAVLTIGIWLVKSEGDGPSFETTGPMSAAVGEVTEVGVEAPPGIPCIATVVLPDGTTITFQSQIVPESGKVEFTFEPEVPAEHKYTIGCIFEEEILFETGEFDVRG